MAVFEAPAVLRRGSTLHVLHLSIWLGIAAGKHGQQAMHRGWPDQPRAAVKPACRAGWWAGQAELEGRGSTVCVQGPARHPALPVQYHAFWRAPQFCTGEGQHFPWACLNWGSQCGQEGKEAGSCPAGLVGLGRVVRCVGQGAHRVAPTHPPHPPTTRADRCPRELLTHTNTKRGKRES